MLIVKRTGGRFTSHIVTSNVIRYRVKPVQDSTTHTTKTQTPFDRFKEFAAAVFQAPKPSIPKPRKKAKKK